MHLNETSLILFTTLTQFICARAAFSSYQRNDEIGSLLLTLKYVLDNLIGLSSKIFMAMKVFQQARSLKNGIY